MNRVKFGADGSHHRRPHAGRRKHRPTTDNQPAERRLIETIGVRRMLPPRSHRPDISDGSRSRAARRWSSQCASTRHIPHGLPVMDSPRSGGPPPTEAAPASAASGSGAGQSYPTGRRNVDVVSIEPEWGSETVAPATDENSRLMRTSRHGRDCSIKCC